MSEEVLLLPGDSHTLATFIDSGADGNIMDESLAMQLGLEKVPLVPLVPLGHLLGTVTHQTSPLHMLLSGNHHETILFHLLPSSNIPLILGHPWLCRHNPRQPREIMTSATRRFWL